MAEQERPMLPDKLTGTDLSIIAGSKVAQIPRDANDPCQNRQQAGYAIVGAVIRLAGAASEGIPENGLSNRPLCPAALLETVVQQVRADVEEHQP